MSKIWRPKSSKSSKSSKKYYCHFCDYTASQKCQTMINIYRAKNIKKGVSKMVSKVSKKSPKWKL